MSEQQKILRREYIMSFTDDEYNRVRHIWMVSCETMAIHVWIQDTKKEGVDRYYGGIEIHRASPPDYAPSVTPSNDYCWALGKPCWHDGSSLWASEYWIPLWDNGFTPHDHMLRRIEGELLSRLREEATP